MSATIDLNQFKKTYIDRESRSFHYLLIKRSNTNKVVVHFTAFFGDWGDRKEYKENYQGYFHRLKMLGQEEDFSSIFICDQYGFTKNGTYYLGENGDLFVERAVTEILETEFQNNNFSYSNAIMIGSSMGATAALKFGLKFNAKAIVAICPHIDLDICAKMQGREPHVAFVCPDSDPYKIENYVYTRQIRSQIDKHDKSKFLPVLYIHSSKDDHGVHFEQVLPLAKSWQDKGGICYLDERSEGGHTSEYCHKKVILRVLSQLFAGLQIDIKELQSFKFLPDEKKTFKFIVRSYLSKISKMLLKGLC